MVGQRLRDTDKIQVQVYNIQAVKVTAHFLYYMIFTEKNRIPLWCIPLLPLFRLYRNLGRDPWLKGSIWFHDF